MQVVLGEDCFLERVAASESYGLPLPWKFRSSPFLVANYFKKVTASPLWKTVDVNFDSIVVAIGFFFYHSRAWSGLRK